MKPTVFPQTSCFQIRVDAAAFNCCWELYTEFAEELKSAAERFHLQ